MITTPSPRTALAALAVTLLAGSLTACGSDADADNGRITVVASTNVWGDVASSVGGDDVDVTSVISDPSQDPHSFEADPDTLLAVSKADLVVENGGGYDDFVDTLLESSKTDADVVDAVEVSGREAADGEELNEHVWYDLPSVQKVARELADRFGEIDPDHAADFDVNADELVGDIDKLLTQVDEAKPADAGKAIGITEPVPLYLTEALGLADRTPEEFSEAIEEGDDVAVSVLQQTLDLYADGTVDALVYNEQTSGPITEKVRDAAESAGIPVVGVTETLPEGQDYVSWMRANIDAITKAVSS